MSYNTKELAEMMGVGVNHINSLSREKGKLPPRKLTVRGYAYHKEATDAFVAKYLARKEKRKQKVEKNQ